MPPAPMPPQPPPGHVEGVSVHPAGMAHTLPSAGGPTAPLRRSRHPTAGLPVGSERLLQGHGSALAAPGDPPSLAWWPSS